MTKQRRVFAAAMGAIVIFAVAGLTGCSAIGYMTGQKSVPLELGGPAERTPIYHQGDWIIARASMHNHTIYSDGQRTPEDLLQLARLEGMAILAYNDHRERGVCYRDNVCLPINGIEKVGYEKYFDSLGQIKAANPDLLVLMGAEVIPYYFNVGKAPNFTIIGENRHFTVYGINDPQVFWDMPARREMRDLSPEPMPGLTPYQEFVDYIVDHGGIVHTVHVESQQDDWYGPAHFISPRPVNHIHDLKHITDFSILPEGYHSFAGGPGGGWDSALLEYLLGARDQVPWAMGDADYHEASDTLARATTLFYLREFTEDEVFNSLREGRMVALMGASFQDCYVSRFSVSPESEEPSDPIMFGETITVSAPPVIRFSLNRELPDVRALLIRNGVVIHEVKGCSFEYVDRETFDKNLPAVYRVEMRGPRVEKIPGQTRQLEPDSELFTNPIFVYIER